jgi:pyridinium-3,5-biscarboxylic acid mononucleotide sulfurtransferase
VGVDEKYKSLQETLRSLHRVVVAYSGGVDSAFLLKAALETLGPDNVLACIGVSGSLSAHQHEQAHRLAKAAEATLREVPVDEMEDPAYAANRPDRCFHCKSHLFGRFLAIAQREGYGHVVCGNNLDDQDDYRPGNRAAAQLGVRAPLMEAGLTKADIRELSRRLGLETADIPASPCLASRIPYGLEITAERLEQVEKAETLLRSLGFVEFRVRHHGDVARIEVRPEDMSRVIEPAIRNRIVEGLKSLGFLYIGLDLQGFRSGALNEALNNATSE